MENGEQPITPSMWTRCGNSYEPLKDGQKTGWEVKFGGLTKREYFALHLMQGILSRNRTIDITSISDLEHASSSARIAADCLLKELENN